MGDLKKKKRIMMKRKELTPKMHFGNWSWQPEERTLKYSVSGGMLVPLTVTERTSGLEDGEMKGIIESVSSLY